MTWKSFSMVFKGYATGDGKKATMKVKNAPLFQWDDVQKCESFGAVLHDGYVDISFDSDELSQKFWDMADSNGWNCLILENPVNGHIHSYWRDSKKRIEKNGKDKKLAVGLIADIHSGSTYIPLRVNGVDRFPPSFDPENIDEVPDELLPVNTSIDLLSLGEGDGRNDELFKYILILQSQLMLDREPIRHILDNINRFIFSEPLSQQEMDVITRDEAFDKPTFYDGKTFQHDRFGRYMINEFHCKKLNGRLHIYDNGIYRAGYSIIEKKMTEVISNLRANARTETLKYLEMWCEDAQMADARYIAFRNGIYDIVTDEMLQFTPDIPLTNQIPWDYNPEAYDELLDRTLNRLSCNDDEIRSVLEECVGYCFYRRNELSKSFILTGDGANGKSTFLETLQYVLSEQNYSALDIGELSERFSTVTLAGVLANIGDDIDDEFLQGKNISNFKKIVSGNSIKAENKGEKAFFFKPYTKLIFSANEIPRMRNKGFSAIKRRLVIIPFNATFTRDDDDYDEFLKYKLRNQSTVEYMIRLGVEGLKRVLKNHGFTTSEKIQKELDDFEKDNNPILQFIDETDESEIINQETRKVFLQYDVFCSQNGYTRTAKQTFTKEINRLMGLERSHKRIGENKRTAWVFVRKGEGKK